MGNLNFRFLSKLGLSLILAFLFSKILVEKVTFPSSPVIRPTFKNQVSQLPENLRSTATRISERLLASQNPNLPPAWSKPPPRYFSPPNKTPTFSYQYPTQPPILTSPTPSAGYPTTTPSSTPIPNQPTPTSPPEPTPTPATSPGTAPSQAAKELLDLINNERGKNGKPLISFENHLNLAAQKHADDMRMRNYFSHISPEGKTPVDRANAAGYSSHYVGENIAKGLSSASAVFNAWMGSSGHRENMLNGSWHSVGIGLSGTIWVLLMGNI